MVNALIKICCIALIFFVPSDINSQSQTRRDIRKKEKELQSLRNEIKSLDQKIRESVSKEKKELSIIDDYDNQLRLLKRLLNELEVEEKSLSEQITEKQNELKVSESELNSLRSEYAKQIVNLYKFGRKNEWELLLTSGSINQALIRYKYLEKFSEERRRRIDQIVEKAEEVKEERESLSKTLGEKEALRQVKIKDESSLKIKISNKREFIASLRNDKSALMKDLERKKSSVQKITSLISDLIIREQRERELVRQRELERQREIERKRAEEAANRSTVRNESRPKPVVPPPSKTELDTYFEILPTFNLFSKAKGVLPWPVSSRRIINKFGEQRNEQLNTVTLNYGVDIASAFGSNVQVIADGRVSIVHWLPGFGTVVIVTHTEEYRTVYAYLSDVLVSEGAIVRRGDVIARSGESLYGEMLHFEIWKEREKQNPEMWLARR
ncbi:MAG: hypothetical protein FJ213_05340 [Ignavibacteria bacterium]|nr:hypothetical protein [Ignavibacteria bacterium]